MEKNVTKSERKRRRKLSAKLAAMLGLPIAATSCGPVDTVSNVGTNYNEEPKKPVIEQETTEKTTVDMTIEEILTTRKSSTINNTVTTANNSYNNNDYYYDDTVYLDPEDVPTYQEPGIPQYQPQTQGNTQGNTQKPTQGSTQGNTQQSTQGSTQKPTKPETKPTSKPTTNESKTTTKTETPTSKKTTTTSKKTTTTSKKTTTTTKKTTITTTTKPTTTTTTTTKKPETTTTQAPVIEEPVVDEFILENIDKNAGVLEWYSSALMNEMMQGYYIETEYNDYVTGGVESEVLLTMLNKDYEIDDDVLSEVFNCYSDDEIRNSVKFFYMYADVINSLGSNVDYVKYTLNEKIGIYLNELDNAYRNGQIDEFLFNSFENGTIPEECLCNPGVMSILCSYDKNNVYLNPDDINNEYVEEYINYLINVKNSKTYTR